MVFLTNSLAGWSGALHESGGNLSFADGRALSASERALRTELKTYTNQMIPLAMPP